MKAIRKITAMLLACLMLFALAACGGQNAATPDPTPAGDAPNQNDTPAQPGDGIVAVEDLPQSEGGEAPAGIQEGTSIHYHLSYTVGVPTGAGGSTEADYFVQYNVYDTLLKPTGSDWSNLRGAVAESWEVSDDNLTYTFHIRPGVTFSNGDTVDAYDVEYTLDTIAESRPNDVSFIASYEAVDDATFVVTLVDTMPTFLGQFSNFIYGIRDKELCESTGDPTAQETWVGCGPYYIDSFTRDAEIVLKANPNYWDKENMPHIETVYCDIIPDSNTAFVAMQTGELDILTDTTYIQAQQLASSDNCYVATYYSPATYTIYFNTTREPFTDVRVRQALNYCVDKEEVNLAAFDGMGYPININWYDGSPNYVPDEELPVTYEYDPEKGIALLAEAGLEPSDISFTVLHSTNLDCNVLCMENVQAQLLALGFNVELMGVNEATLQSTVIADDYDAVLFTGGSNLYNNTQIYFNMFTFNGRVNLPQYAEGDEVGDRMTDLVTRAKFAANMEESGALAAEATGIAVENALYLPMCVRPLYVVCGSHVQGLTINESDRDIFLQYLWLDE